MALIEIDGSFGEGGGQIVRSAITLSCITGKPVKIINIRKNRKIPGLRNQHLLGIKILSKICNAKVEGLKIGSLTVKFTPTRTDNKILTEDIGTAGSIPLILQMLIPTVSILGKKLKLSIKGGTDVPYSPTINYTKKILAEAYDRMGIKYSLNIRKRGYYPKGGGLVDLEVFPVQKLKPISLLKQKNKNVKILCTFSKENEEKIREQVNNAKSLLEKNGFSVKIDIKSEAAIDKGSSVLLYSFDENSISGIDDLAINRQNFGINIAKMFLDYNLGVDDHLADMLVIPASLQNKLSIFRVNKITKHLETNLYTTAKISGCKYGVSKIGNGFEIRIVGSSKTTL